MYECIKCLNKYKSINTIYVHQVKGCPSEQNKPNIDLEKTNTCNTCKKDLNYLKNYQNIYYHKRTCGMRDKLVCLYCGQSFVLELYLNNHNLKYHKALLNNN
jgi:hypothetical protein